MAKRKSSKKQPMRCPNCDGGLLLEDPSYGLTCPRCEIRVAGPFESAHDIPDYVPAKALSRRHAVAKKRGRYYIVQFDDEGSRRIGQGLETARDAAEYVASIVPWIDVDAFASTWNANSPHGGERFEIGHDDK